MLPNTQELIAVFNKINADCQESGELVAPLTDVDFYADQIENIYEVDEATALAAAQAMADHVAKQDVNEDGLTPAQERRITEMYDFLYLNRPARKQVEKHREQVDEYMHDALTDSDVLLSMSNQQLLEDYTLWIDNQQ